MTTKPHIILFAVLFCAAMLAYSGRVLGIDGRASLATSATLARHGEWHMNVISAQHWTASGAGGQVVIAPNGDSYSKKAPLVALAHLPLMWLGHQISGNNAIQIALLTIPVIFAITGVLLYVTMRRFTIPHTWAVIGVLWWGLGTFALTNVKEVFAEPIMAAGLTLSAYAIIAPDLRGRNLWAGIGAACLIGGNLASAVLLPMIWIGLIWPFRSWRDTLRQTISFVLPVAVMISLIAYLNLARTETLFSSGYRFGNGEGFITPLWIGLGGLLLGGYRGLLWYAPIAFFAPFAILTRQRRGMIGLSLLMIMAQTIVFSLWWAWHGGNGWGPRFLLPVLPIMVMLAIPIVQRLWQQSAVTKSIVVVLMLYSAMIQIPGALVHYIDYEVKLYGTVNLTEDPHIATLAFL